MDNNGKCVKKDDPNCKTYNDVGVCTECMEKYMMDFERNRCTEKKDKNYTKCAED